MARETASAAEIESRLKSTIQKYDQVVALTENNVNANLKYRYEDKTTGASMREFTYTSESEEDGDTITMSINATLDPPKIKFLRSEKESSSSQPKAYFILQFQKGEFKPPMGSAVKLSGFKLAFEAKLELDNPTDQEQAKIKQERNVPGIYTIDRLLFNFTQSDTATWIKEHSETPGLTLVTPDGKSEPLKVTFFKTMMTRYLEDILKKGHNLIAYAVSLHPSKPANEVGAKFPPTALRFQTMAFHPEGKADDVPVSHTHHCILFTEMCGNTFPNNNLRWTGNWVTKDVPGTMALAKHMFIDKYLLQQLESVSVVMVETANIIASLADPNSDVNNAANFPWVISKEKPAITDSKYDWKVENSGGSFTWKDRAYSSWSKIKVMFTEDWSKTYDTTIDSTIKYDAGANTFKVSADLKNKLTVTMSEWGWMGGAGARTETNAEIKLKWNLTFTLKSIANTGIEVTISQNISDPTVTNNVDLSKAGPLDALSGIFDPDRATREKAKIENSLKTGISSLKLDQRITDSIQGQNIFVLPGNGTFFFSDPVFNNEGDLLVTLRYK